MKDEDLLSDEELDKELNNIFSDDDDVGEMSDDELLVKLDELIYH